MKRITGLIADGFKNLSGVEEEIPARLLLSGENGVGKTARLEAVRYALQGAPGRDGFLPFMSGDACQVGVAVDTFKVLRGAKVAVARGKVSVKGLHSCEPTRGESKPDSVAARLEGELAPDLFLLSLTGWLSESANERRRSLLTVLQPLTEDYKAETVALTMDALLVGNDEYTRLREAFPPDGDALTWLSKMEQAAKAAVSEATGKRDDARRTMASLSEEIPAVLMVPLAKLKADREALLEEVNQRKDERVAGQKLAEQIAQATRERDAALIRIPDTLKDTPLDEIEAKAAESLKASKAAHRRIVVREETAADDETTAGLVLGRAKKAVDAKTGALTAYRGAVDEADPDDPAGCCPVCGADGGLDQARKTIKAAEEQLSAARRVEDKAQEAYAATRRKAQQASDAEDLARGVVALASDDEVAVGLLLASEARLKELKEQATGRPQTDADWAGLTERRRALDERIEEATRAEERMKRHRQAAADEKKWEAVRAEAVTLAKDAGPSGCVNGVLSIIIEPLQHELTRIWGGYRDGELSVGLADSRGNPDAALNLTRGGRVTPFTAMSGGEQAVALAAMMSALAGVREGRAGVALIEAGEIDVMGLCDVCELLSESPLANVIIATHIPVLDDTLGAFEVRRLEA